MPRKSTPLSSLSCIVRVSEEARSVAIDQAIELARVQDAHLLVTIIAPKASLPYSPMGSAFVAPVIADLNMKIEKDSNALAIEAQEKIRKAGITGDVRVFLNHVDVVAADAVRLARASDMIIVDQPTAMLDTKALVLEEALFHSGRPILVASPKSPMRGTVAHVMVAWDGSSHAARAVGDALALFPSIVDAEIVSIRGEKNLDKTLPGAQLAHHLAHKGVTTTLTELEIGSKSVAEMLDKRANESGADLLIMGGFGHSRLREFLFGGVTLELTENASVPLLMSY